MSMKVYTRRQLMLEKGRPYDAEIEYLRSSGTQYINCGIRLSNNSEMVIKVRALINSTCYLAGGKGFYIAQQWRGSNVFACFRTDTRLLSGINGYSSVNTFKLNNTGFYANDVLKAAIEDSTAFTTTSNAAIFRVNGIGDVSPSIVYYLKISNEGILVRDLIPVRKGQVGYMYDRVSKQLFGNAGTGDFILGPDK